MNWFIAAGLVGVLVSALAVWKASQLSDTQRTFLAIALVPFLVISLFGAISGIDSEHSSTAWRLAHFTVLLVCGTAVVRLLFGRVT